MGKVSKEVALNDYKRMCETLGIDDSDAEDQQQRIVSAIESGQLLINDDGLPVLTTSDGPVVFNEPTGATFLAMDTVKQGEDVKRMFAVAKELTRGKLQAGKLPARQVKVVMAIVALFLAM